MTNSFSPEEFAQNFCKRKDLPFIIHFTGTFTGMQIPAAFEKRANDKHLKNVTPPAGARLFECENSLDIRTFIKKPHIGLLDLRRHLSDPRSTIYLSGDPEIWNDPDPEDPLSNFTAFVAFPMLDFGSRGGFCAMHITFSPSDDENVKTAQKKFINTLVDEDISEDQKIKAMLEIWRFYHEVRYEAKTYTSEAAHPIVGATGTFVRTNPVIKEQRLDIVAQRLVPSPEPFAQVYLDESAPAQTPNPPGYE